MVRKGSGRLKEVLVPTFVVFHPADNAMRVYAGDAGTECIRSVIEFEAAKLPDVFDEEDICTSR